MNTRLMMIGSALMASILCMPVMAQPGPGMGGLGMNGAGVGQRGAGPGPGPGGSRDCMQSATPRHARHINKLESRLAKHARIKLVQTVANAWLNKCRILIVASRATHSSAKRARRCIRNAKARPAQPSVNAPNRKCRLPNATLRQIQNVANCTTRRVKLVKTSLAQSIRPACENSLASSSRHATVPPCAS